MSERLPAVTEARDPKFNFAYNPEQLERFEPDHPEAPVISFVREGDDNYVQLIVMEHTRVSHPMAIHVYGEDRVFKAKAPMQLIYSPDEWVAYYTGAKAGQFDRPPETALPAIRDSKATDQHFFVFTPAGYDTFTNAVKSGKYDLSPQQHAEVAAQLAAARQTSTGRS